MSEHHEQCAAVDWFKWTYPKLQGCIYSVPNGAHIAGNPRQRAAKIARMKKEGFKNGVSDLFIAVPRGTFHGMVLEMKDVNKKESAVTPDQADHLELMAQQGYYSCWAAGADIAIEQIKQYMEL